MKQPAAIHIDQLIRSNRKTVALVVTREGQLIVRAPLRTPIAMIESFVQQKQAWIMEKQRQAQAFTRQAIPHSFTAGESFLFMGRAYPLVICPRSKPLLELAAMPAGTGAGPCDIGFHEATGKKGAGGQAGVQQRPIPPWVADEQALTSAVSHAPKLVFALSAAAQADARAVFERWYRAQALLVLRERVAHWSALTGLATTGLRITSARTRWGSCSGLGVLSFPWRLVMAPLPAIDYVVVHELVHITEKNHARAFWQGVGRILPGYAAQVAWLRENGHWLALE